MSQTSREDRFNLGSSFFVVKFFLVKRTNSFSVKLHPMLLTFRLSQQQQRSNSNPKDAVKMTANLYSFIFDFPLLDIPTNHYKHTNTHKLFGAAKAGADAALPVPALYF